MQTIGHIIIHGEKLLILIREKRHSRQFKIRRAGADGIHMTAEEEFLSESPDHVAALKAGEVIEL